MKRLLSGLSIPVALFLVHCGSNVDSSAADGGGGSGANGGSTTTSGGNGGSGTTTSTGDLAAQIIDGCGLTKPCAGVLLNCGNDQWNEDCTEPYGAATQCALERLAAGEAFALHFDINGLNGEEEWSDFVFDGAGSAVRVDSIESPDGGEVSSQDPVKCTLATPETFQSCLTVANDDPLHGQCMFFDSWFVDCSAKASSCPE